VEVWTAFIWLRMDIGGALYSTVMNLRVSPINRDRWIIDVQLVTRKMAPRVRLSSTSEVSSRISATILEPGPHALSAYFMATDQFVTLRPKINRVEDRLVDQTKVLGENLPLRSPQIPHDLAWDRTQAVTVGSLRLCKDQDAKPTLRLSLYCAENPLWIHAICFTSSKPLRHLQLTNTRPKWLLSSR
jgi:hypothetical protein